MSTHQQLETRPPAPADAAGAGAASGPLREEELHWAAELIDRELSHLEHEPFTPQLRRHLIETVGSQVRAAGLWAPHLAPADGGRGLGWEELARLFEVLGRNALAPIAFGCWPPDSVNAQLLSQTATDAQRSEWLVPLVSGRYTSAFAMTEPGAGSDPSQLSSTAVRDGDDWILNGRKTWITNASRADFLIGLFITDPEARAGHQASMFIIPAGTPGLRVVRNLANIANPAGDDGAVDLHSELAFEDVRIPDRYLLGDRGAGFRLAQIRLAAARLQHCMRWIGLAEKALDLMCSRAATRQAHGSLLQDKATVQQYIARAATGIHLSRLLVLDTARRIDATDTRQAREQIAMCKVFVAETLSRTVDDAIQVNGAMGASTDLPLEAMARFARLTRILDGPDEVHQMAISRRVVADRTKGAR